MTDQDSSDNKYTALLKTSKINGWSITIFALLILLINLLSGSILGIIISGLVIVSGAAELMGRKKLMSGDPLSTVIMPVSQFGLMVLIWVYCIIQLTTFDPVTAMAFLDSASMEQIKAMGRTEEQIHELVASIIRATYIAVFIVTGLYQGGLGVYYYRGTRYILAEKQES